MSQAIRYPLIRGLIDPKTNLVRFASLKETHNFLVNSRLQLVDKEPYGIGFHLFYIRGDILIRIKTHGDSSGPRENQAHLSIANWSGSLEYKDEWGKADRTGLVRGAPTRKNNFENFSLWALATHFNFKNKYLFGAENLIVRHGNT
jgi:hypothetical protein